MLKRVIEESGIRYVRLELSHVWIMRGLVAILTSKLRKGLKQAKNIKMIFLFFTSLCVPVYSSKDQSLKFWWKNIENWRFWKTLFFFFLKLDFFNFFNLFCIIPMKMNRKNILNFEDYPGNQGPVTNKFLAMHIIKLYITFWSKVSLNLSK